MVKIPHHFTVDEAVSASGTVQGECTSATEILENEHGNVCLVFDSYLGNGLSLSKLSHPLVYQGRRDRASVVVRECGGKTM